MVTGEKGAQWGSDVQLGDYVLIVSITDLAINEAVL